MRTSPSPISRRTLLKGALSGAVAPVAVMAIGSRARARTEAPPLAATAFDAGVVTSWCDEILELIRTTPGYSPPVAARAIGYAGVALYEALQPGIPYHPSLAGQLAAMPHMPAAGRNATYAWPVVANAALAEVLRRLFPTATAERLAALDRLEASLASTAPRGIRERSAERGRDVAAAIFAWSTTDGGHEGYLRNVQPDYRPPEGEGLWVPTPPGFLPPLQPRWGSNRTFVSAPPACDLGPPPPYSTDPGSPCFAEALEVYAAVNGLTAEQLAVARFWADDPRATSTPPGHSLAILSQVIRDRDADLATSARAFARLGIAVADAFVICWRTKYSHHLLRPITYIRQTIDPAWGNPLPVTTPPFPEYTSGHSVQSGAAASVLTAEFGPVAFIDRTHEWRGLAPRAFASFDAFAAEAAVSRLYGGIHFRSAIERGLEQGRCVGGRAALIGLAQDWTAKMPR